MMRRHRFHPGDRVRLTRDATCGLFLRRHYKAGMLAEVVPDPDQGMLVQVRMDGTGRTEFLPRAALELVLAATPLATV